MDFEHLQAYCLAKKGATADFPFDEETLVFKVVNKMFALTVATRPEWVNLKCDPARALELRATYEEVQPGYHMNKRHWNTVRLSGRLTDSQIEGLIDHSYDLVVKGLTRAQRRALENIGGSE